MNKLKTTLGKHEQTNHVSLIPYNPECEYKLEFQPVKVTNPEHIVYLFCGCGVDNEYTANTYVSWDMKIQRTKGEIDKEILLFDDKLPFTDKQPAAVDEEPGYVAYYYWYEPIFASIPLGHWKNKSDNIYLQIHVVTNPIPMGYFGGKFITNHNQHEMIITETKYEYEKSSDSRKIVF